MGRASKAGAVSLSIKSVKVLRLKPGDTIVVTADHDLDEEERERLHKHVAPLWPDHRVIVLTPGLDIKVVRR